MRLNLILLVALIGLAGCHGNASAPVQNTLTVPGGTPGTSCASAEGSECIGH
jgi:hypothetical protein